MRRILLLLSFITSIHCAFGQSYPSDTIHVDINSANPAFPFPQFLEYNFGKTLAENNAEGVTHADMEKGMREAYTIMMRRALYTGDAVGGVPYIVFNHGSVPENFDTFVSEGDGYALLAAAYMADKATFDGLWMWIHDNRLSGVTTYKGCNGLRTGYRYGKGLPGWKNDATTGGTNPDGTDIDQGDNNSATDGDYDIAMGLLMAYKQWGENSGVMTDCGTEMNYKEEALSMIKAIVDTVTIMTLGNEPVFNGFISGDVGIDGYTKNGNTWGELTNWRYDPLENTTYTWAYDAPNTYASKGGVDMFTDYVGPSYFRQFREFLEVNGGTDWQINQFRRGEASADWLMNEMNKKGYIASSGKCSVSDDGTSTSFSNHPSGPLGEDFRASWRTILNYVWHGNPEYTWNAETHEVDYVTNSYEYDMGVVHAKNLKAPGSNAGAEICSTFGSSPDAASPNFSGPAHIPQHWAQNGTIGQSSNRVNYNVGSGAPAAVASEDLELIADIYRQSEIMWDGSSTSVKREEEEKRYILSTPKYFHGWFRLLGMLTTSGNLHPPTTMEPNANMKVYLDVDKSYAYSGDNVTYTISYRNYGSANASGVSLSVPIGNDYSFVSASNGGSISGGNITWSIGSVSGFTTAGGATASSGEVTFTVNVNSLTEAKRACLQATVSASNSASWVSNEYPNNATYTMERNCVDLLASRSLKLEKSANKKKLNPGNEVLFTLDFENESGGEASWLNGGRSHVSLTYGHWLDGTELFQFSRIWHDATEAYINLSNYRISYFLNSPSFKGLYDASTNPNGWKFVPNNGNDAIKYGYDPASMVLSFQNIPYGSDEHGSWNQRIITRYSDVLTSPASHIFDKLDNPYLIHKGAIGPSLFRTMLQTPTSTSMVTEVADDWSFSSVTGAKSNSAQDDKLFGVTNSWADVNNLDIPVDKYGRYDCDPPITNFDRILVEEWDGYTWRRIAGTGPLPGREAYNVEIIDTIPLQYSWVGFTDAVALDQTAVYTAAPNGAAYTGIVRMVIPTMLVGEKGDIKYVVAAYDPGCPGAPDEEAPNSAWIKSQTDSPDSSTVNVLITCAYIEPELGEATMTKIPDKTSVVPADQVQYAIEFEQTYGTISRDDFTGNPSGNWVAPTGSGGLPDSWSDLAEPHTSTSFYYENKSHGTNGRLEFKMDIQNAWDNFSLLFRYKGGVPGQASFDGVALNIWPGPQGQGKGIAYSVQDGNTVVETKGSMMSPVSIPVDGTFMTVYVDLREDTMKVWFNSDPESNPQTILLEGKGLRVQDGYVGFYNGKADNSMGGGSGPSGANSLVKWDSRFDSAFDVELADVLPAELSFVSASGTYVQAGDRVTWDNIPGPVLYGTIISETITTNVDACSANDNVINTSYANSYGLPVDSIGAQSLLPCSDGSTPTCAPPTSITLTEDSACVGEALTLPSTVAGTAVLDEFYYTWIDPNSVAGTPSTTITDLDFTSIAAADAGIWTLRIEDGNNDDAACYIEETVVITVNDIPQGTPILTGESALCQDSSYLYTVSGVTDADDYRWVIPTGTSFGTPDSIGLNSDQIEIVASALTAGNVEVTPYNYCGDGTPASAITTSLTLSLGAFDFVSFTDIMDELEVLNAEVNVPNATSYEWIVSGTSSSALATETITMGTADIPVTIIARNACDSISFDTVIYYNAPDLCVPPTAALISAPNGTSFCAGETVDLEANLETGYKYTWIDSTAGTTNILNGTGLVIDDNTITITSPSSGVYAVEIVSDGYETVPECMLYDTITLTETTQPATPVMDGYVDAQIDSACNGATVSLTASASSDYVWNSGHGETGTGSSFDFTMLLDTWVSVKSVATCGISDSITVNFTLQDVPSAPSITGTFSTCANDPSVLQYVADGGVFAESYIWTTTATEDAASTTNTYGLTVGATDETVSVIAVNELCGNSLKTDSTIKIISDPIPTISIVQIDTVCVGGNTVFNLDVTNGGSTPTVSATVAGSPVAVGVAPNYEFIINSVIGGESIDAQVVSSSACVSLANKTQTAPTETLEAEIAPDPATIITKPSGTGFITCKDTIYHEADPATNGVWSLVDPSLANITITGEKVAIHDYAKDDLVWAKWTVPAIQYCKDNMDSVKLLKTEEITPADFTFNDLNNTNDIVCIGGNDLQLLGNSTGTETSTWSLVNTVGAGTLIDDDQPTAILSGVTPGEVEVTLLKEVLGGQCSSTITKTVTVFDPNTDLSVNPADLVSLDVCKDESKTFNVLNPETGYTYDWSTINGSTPITQTGTSATVEFSTPVATESVTLVKKNDECVLDVADTTVIVNIKSAPIPSFVLDGDDSPCPNGEATYKLTGDVTGYTFKSWSIPSDASYTSIVLDSIVVQFGTSDGDIVLTADHECKTDIVIAQKAITIQDDVAPVANFSSDELAYCEDENANYTISVVSGSVDSYVWEINGTDQLVNSTVFTAPSSVSSTTISAKVIWKNCLGVESEEVATQTGGFTQFLKGDPSILYKGLIINDGDDIQLCEGETIEIKPTSSGVWNPTLGNDGVINKVKKDDEGLYTFTTGNDVCGDTTASFNLIVNTQPSILFTDGSGKDIREVDTEMYIPFEEEDKIMYLEGSGMEGAEFDWAGSDLEITGLQVVTPGYTVVETEADISDNPYLFTVTATTPGTPCFDTASTYMLVIPQLLPPTAFTPNGDELNDEWKIAGIERYPNARVQVFNRWGHLVFSLIGDYQDSPWDGTRSNKVMPTGTYYFVIELNDPAFPKPIMGTVTLLE